MSSNVILNKKNIINNDNSELRYEFNKPHTFEKGDKVALSHLNLFYSWFNITQQLNNNRFQYVWWDSEGKLTDIITITIPDGYYSVSTLNEFLQSQMVNHNHYLTNGSNNIYFIEFLTNSTYYSVEIRLSSLKSIEEFGDDVIKPVNATWNLPTNDSDEAIYQTPQINILSNNNFYKYLGFNPGSLYEDLTIQPSSTSQYSFLNDFNPSIDPSFSYLITCNLIKNDLAVPNNVLTSFSTPPGVSIGDNISISTDLVYSTIQPGTYREIVIKLYDQDFNLMKIKDNNMLFVLSIIKQNN